MKLSSSEIGFEFIYEKLENIVEKGENASNFFKTIKRQVKPMRHFRTRYT